MQIQRDTILKVPQNHHTLYSKFEDIRALNLKEGFEYINSNNCASMELSSRRVFRLRVPISLHWTRRYKAGYVLLDSTSDEYGHEEKPKRGSAPPILRLGHGRKKGLFIAGMCRRFRVRIVRMRNYSWGLLLKRLKAFYLRLLTDIMETGPTVEMIMNSAPLIYPHSF